MARWIVYVTQQGEERPTFAANSREEAEEMAERIRRVAERLGSRDVVTVRSGKMTGTDRPGFGPTARLRAIW
jgi:hypothetical protein